MIHARIDHTRWITEFPLDLRKPPSWDDLRSIAGPERFALYLQALDIMADTPHLPEAVLTDICLWNVGEAPLREMTKLGGLPYMPRDLEWPSYDGEPLVFLGQFCFADSLDIVRDLPAEVLLMFSQAPGDCPGYHHFEWVPLGVKNLIGPRSVPKTKVQFRPCYASLFRACDYDTHRPLQAGTTEEDRYDWDRVQYPLFFHGTKIGGVSTRVEGDCPEGIEPPPPPPGFLAQLDSIGWRNPERWPFLNLARGDWEMFSRHGFLELIGGGTLFLHLNKNNEVEHYLYFS